jgi:hypothetical protein
VHESLFLFSNRIQAIPLQHVTWKRNQSVAFKKEGRKEEICTRVRRGDTKGEGERKLAKPAESER